MSLSLFRPMIYPPQKLPLRRSKIRGESTFPTNSAPTARANKPGGYCGVRGSGGVVVVLVGGAREDRRTAAIATKSTATTETRFGITAKNFFLSRAPQRQ